MVTPEAPAQNCGGEERWAVKMGGDAGAGTIVTTSPIPTLLHLVMTDDTLLFSPGGA